MDAATSFDNNFVAGMAAEKYFEVKFQLVCYKHTHTQITHVINSGIYYIYR